MKSHLSLLRNHVFCSRLHPFDLRPVPKIFWTFLAWSGYRIELSDVEGDADCHLQFYPSRVAAGFLFPGVCPFDYILPIFGLRRHTNPDRYLNKNDANCGDSQDSLPEMIPETLESAVNASASDVSCVSTIQKISSPIVCRTWGNK